MSILRIAGFGCLDRPAGSRLVNRIRHGSPLGAGIAAIRLVGGRHVRFDTPAVVVDRRYRADGLWMARRVRRRSCRVEGDFEFLRRSADRDVGFVDAVEPAL